MNAVTQPRAYSFESAGADVSYFEISEGKVVWNLVLYDDDSFVSYPGWSSKDSSGEARLVIG